MSGQKARKVQLGWAIFAGSCLSLAAAAIPAGAGILWYNGDFDGQAGYANQIDTSTLSSNKWVMFERFDVTDTNGWDITSLWSANVSSDNSFFSAGVTQADWSIRVGMGTGNAGTVLFGGTASLTLIPTGRAYVTHVGTNLEYKLEITGLNLYLPQGQYWMDVTPYSSGDAAISSTVGANAVGTPTGNANPGLWWWSDGTYNYEFVPQAFSMGVGGSVAIPEPWSLWLAAVGALLLCLLVPRRSARL